MHFKVSTSRIERDGLLVSVEGELDLFTAEQVERSVEPAILGRRPLLLDLSQCPFIDSTGLRLVLKIHEDLTKGEGPAAPMAVVAASEVRQFFTVSAIDLSVPVFLDREEALASLAAAHGQPNPSTGERDPTRPPAIR
jgi:stage II sporulation protein AA (anti-sigma F factor antagonist)